MLQTNSNQPFIFSSPRLREQIGASFEITLLSHWVEEDAKELLSLKKLPSSFWVSDSSGKVIVRFTETDGDPKELAKRLIREVTFRALTDAPGLDVTGVFVKGSSNTVCADDLQEHGKHSMFPFSPTKTPVFRHLHRQTKTRRTPCLSPRASSARGHGQLDAFSSRRSYHVGRQMILTRGRKK